MALRALIFSLPVVMVLSCEDVIQLNLPNSGPHMTITGSISNYSDSVKVKVSMSTDYFTPTAIKPVINADVRISDTLGNSYQLTGMPDGTYYIANLAGTPGRKYILKVKSSDTTYSAMSTMPELVPIDSLTIEYRINRKKDSIPTILCYFRDPASIANYYMIKLYKNDTLFSPSNGYAVYNDKYFNGRYNSIRIGVGRYNITSFIRGDRIKIQLIGIDRVTYEYFHLLRDILEQSGILSASTPANPPNNLSNNALGYFAAWSVSEKEIVVK